MRFKGKVLWITGASSGIGETLAHAFHGEDAPRLPERI
jgi:NAD(P)-dependent dehydrogenase (short-subunit alcohol dehydrogenase family)